MKKFVFFLFFMSLLSVAMAQLKGKTQCNFVVDILDGKINGFIKPNFPIPEIKKLLPCFTSAEDESNVAKCGGGVFYKDKDIYFYTAKDYVEIGPGFKGKMSIPLMGAKRNSFFKILGNPAVKDDTWDAYQTSYGCLVLHYNAAGKVKLIQFSSLGTGALNLCQ